MTKEKTMVGEKEGFVSRSVNISGGGYRLGYIDALKGFAMLCVVLGHVLMAT